MATLRLPEAYRKLGKAAIMAGWKITVTGGGHLAWRSPSGAVIHTSASPSDHRAVRNNLALFRRAGLQVR